MTALRYRLLDEALARRAAPDFLLRWGARCAAARRLTRLTTGGLDSQEERKVDMVERAMTGPIAEVPGAANDQHYELPPAFMGLFLGPRRKYSAAWWPAGVRDLAAAEEAMLDLTARRALVEDGMEVLDLGCGWGALSMWLAEQYDVRVVAVSNSSRQRRWIAEECDRRGLGDRVTAVTADVSTFDPGRTFDRIVSVEMFEHLRNWTVLLDRMSTWLAPGGLAFVHVFSHRTFAYRFAGTWASERFFTAGIVPSHDLLVRALPGSLRLDRSWALDGTHYARTLEAWLHRFGGASDDAVSVLQEDGRSAREARAVVGTWRLFLTATAEMWAFRGGQEWQLSHYRLATR